MTHTPFIWTWLLTPLWLATAPDVRRTGVVYIAFAAGVVLAYRGVSA